MEDLKKFGNWVKGLALPLVVLLMVLALALLVVPVLVAVPAGIVAFCGAVEVFAAKAVYPLFGLWLCKE